MKITACQLGATLYVPATRPVDNLLEISAGTKWPELRSVIYCTEDSVRDEEIPNAINNLKQLLQFLAPVDNQSLPKPLRFIRVRNPDIMKICLQLPGIEKIQGFVLPKLTASNLESYLVLLSDKDNFMLMPTLETAEVFDLNKMLELRDMFMREDIQRRILCLRIGANDLLSCLRVRRDPNRTIYATAVGSLISQLAGIFIPHGFSLSAPVFEGLKNQAVLREEIKLDLLHGLCGKTAIHPTQIPIIEHIYAVNKQEQSDANQILDKEAPAVFKANGSMCEPATHRLWAKNTIIRAKLYGVSDDNELEEKKGSQFKGLWSRL